MISLPVSYILNGQAIQERESFDVPPLPPIESRGTNETTLRTAIDSSLPDYKDVLQALYRELVLANYAEFDGKRGSSAEPELSRTYPDTGALPHFIRTSGRVNAAGMILYNLQLQHHVGSGYELLPALLAALVEGDALDAPRCVLRAPSATPLSFPEEVNGEGILEGAMRHVTVNTYERSTRRVTLALRIMGMTALAADSTSNTITERWAEG
jgi:hypothetical protein